MLTFFTTLSSTYAEYYQYKDASGNIVFTDDLSQVPENQRPDIKTHQSVKPTNVLIRKKTEPSEPLTQESKSKELEETKRWLANEHDELKQEKERLDAMKADIKTSKDQINYNTKVKIINQRIDLYKKRLTDYQKQVGK